MHHITSSRRGRRSLVATLSVGTVLLAPATGVAHAATSTSSSVIAAMGMDVYAANDPTTQGMFLTLSGTEATQASRYGYTQNSGVVFDAATGQATGLEPVHRLWSTTSGFVFIPAGVEQQQAISQHHFTDQGVAFWASRSQVAGLVPVYRLQTPQGRFSYTLDKALVARHLAAGWRDGQVVFWAKPAATGTSQVPFTVTHATGGHQMVFAHWFAPMPRSIDNADPSRDYYTTGYLDPRGENSAHVTEGGFLRDRPLGRAPIVGDWQLADAKAEIAMAKASGIDGFAVDLLDTKGAYWDRFTTMLTAADEVGGFSIVPQPDMAVAYGKLTPTAMAQSLASVANHRSLYKVDGRMMLSPFDADAQSVTYWTQVLSALRGTWKINPYFVPMLLNSGAQNVRAFAPISDGISDWGSRDDVATRTVDQAAALTHQLGKVWMAPVSPGDYSPAEKVYDESRGAQTLQNTWDRARDEHADMVEVATWNDFSESTGIAPSRDHGWSFADINAWYATRWHNGATPTATGDEAIVVARTQKVAATMGQAQPALLRYAAKAFTQPNDEVEGVVMLSAPAQVTLTSGQHTTTVPEPAGLSVVRVPLDFGTPTITVTRNHQQTAKAALPHPVVASAPTQDLTYWAGSSRPS